MAIKGNLQLMKEINTAMIMNYLHRNEKLTRAELTRMTKLSPTTVSGLIEQLIGRNLVEIIGEKIMPGAGRRALSLQINKNGGYVVGVSLNVHVLTCAIMNLHGEIVTEYRAKLEVGRKPLADQIYDAITACTAQTSEFRQDSMMGIGISAPGIIDERAKTIVYSSQLKVTNFDLHKILSGMFPNVPIQIVNDSNAAAFAEHYFGAGKDLDNLVYLRIDDGIGAGIIVNSDIYSGKKGAAGEIGHIAVDPQGEICKCGQVGCLETVLGSPYVLDKCGTIAAQIGVAAPESMEELLARYEAGEDWLEPIFDRILYVCKVMIFGTVQFLSPEAVIVEGWINRSAKLMEKLNASVETSSFPFVFSKIGLMPATFGEKGALYGSAALMLQKIFSASVLK
ncbi:ROK family transcriptional regulator [Cohnella soli]|uniref:ROK family transcriptional regulator n=1 Tax=Cohnella soli TaxID=425005 RepID=A0ABW0I3U6_9BACL